MLKKGNGGRVRRGKKIGKGKVKKGWRSKTVRRGKKQINKAGGNKEKQKFLLWKKGEWVKKE